MFCHRFQEVFEDPPSNKTVEEEPMTTYCNNGCQGACACPAIDFQITLTSSETGLREHSILTPPPPPENVPHTNPLPEIPKPESQSSIRQRRLSKNTLQLLVDKFVKRDILDDESENQRRGTKSQESKRKRSFFGRKTSSCENALHEKKEQSNRQLRKGGSSKQVSTSRNNKKVNQGGRRPEVRENGGIQEVSKGGRNQGGCSQEINITDKSRREIVIQQQKSKDSLKVLRGMMSFKKTASANGEEEWN